MSKTKITPGARIGISKCADGLIIQIARNNRKQFKGHIITVLLVKKQCEALERDGITDAWFIQADRRRRSIG